MSLGNFWIIEVIIIMSSFIDNPYLQAKLKTTFKAIFGLVVFSVGAGFGHAKAKLQASIDNKDYSEDHLKEYISEDQVNHTIDKTGKPAVLYYYQPSTFHHYIVRHGFIKSSNLCHERADFYLVNLTKKLEKALPEIQHEFPISDYMMEIRFPKDQCSILYNDGSREEKIGYRREFFNHTYTRSGGVENFMEENGLLQAKDPMEDFFKLTKNCLFEPIKQ